MLFAEPGRPLVEERYDAKADPIELLRAGVQHTYECFSAGKDQFHRNARWFLEQLYPDLSFDEQLRHVWMTEGRLCSIAVETAGTKDRTCAAHYLRRQIDLLPNAMVVAFGRKAQHYISGMDVGWLRAFALAPPGANRKEARPSWETAIVEIGARLGRETKQRDVMNRVRRLRAIAERCAELVGPGPSAVEHGSTLYDERGLPR